MQNPFIQRFDQLPQTLPVFPLEGAVIMPGAQLPLNIFEPRYLEMVRDSLASDHLIGMIQPDSQSHGDWHGLCATGCAGRISGYQETPDGRIEILLTGVCRFDVSQELPSTQGYRRVLPNWSRFEADYEYPGFDESRQQTPFFAQLDHYLQSKELEIEQASLHKIPFARLLNVLTTLLPLPHSDKQAIIETVTFDERYKLLISQLELAGSDTPSHLRH